MDTRVYSLNGEVFYVVSTPNAVLSGHSRRAGRFGGDGYCWILRPRFYGEGTDPYGWANKSYWSAEEHNKFGALAWSRVSDPPYLKRTVGSSVQELFGPASSVLGR